MDEQKIGNPDGDWEKIGDPDGDWNMYSVVQKDTSVCSHTECGEPPKFAVMMRHNEVFCVCREHAPNLTRGANTMGFNSMVRELGENAVKKQVKN